MPIAVGAFFCAPRETTSAHQGGTFCTLDVRLSHQPFTAKALNVCSIKDENTLAERRMKEITPYLYSCFAYNHDNNWFKTPMSHSPKFRRGGESESNTIFFFIYRRRATSRQIWKYLRINGRWCCHLTADGG
jgi:hypothetical protein